MTEAELTAIRARLAAVPAGPWWVDAGGPDETCSLVSADNRAIASFPFYAPFRNEGVEKFVANAPTDIALLLSEVDRLRSELAEALATLANDQCRGEPPAPGWEENRTAWYWTPPPTSLPRWTHLACVHRPSGMEWVLIVEDRQHNRVFDGEYETARAAMRAHAEMLPNLPESAR